MGLTISALERASLLDRAVRDALAIYYYPGMWDWDRYVDWAPAPAERPR